MTAPVHKSVKDKSAEGAYVAPRPAPPVELTRRPVRTTGRKHPPYGAHLLENPPPDYEPIRVVLGWRYAKWPMESQPIVIDAPPEQLRFDVVAGRSVRVDHEHTADPDILLSLAQALIDYGATEVRLVIPDRPGARCTDTLRIVPKGKA